MNISYIVNLRIPTSRAHGYAIMKMCSEFAKAGAKMTLFVPQKKDSDKVGDPFEFYGIERNFSLVRLPSLDLLGSTLKFSRFFYWLDLLSFFVSIFWQRAVKVSDVIYTRDFMMPLLFSKKYFLCLELHDIPPNNLFFKIAIKRPKIFLVLNQNLKDELVRMGVAAERIFIFPSGVAVEDFNLKIDRVAARTKLGLTAGPTVLYSGQFYAWKGIDTLAEAAKLMPDVNFVFIGGTDPELTDFKNKYGSCSNISISSFQPREIIPLYQQAADVLVICQSAKEKISTHYSSPLKMFEYMASNRPIVASNLSAIRQTLNEETACFAEADDPASFAASLRKVLTDKSYAERLAQNALAKVSQYAWDKRANQILDLIKTHAKTHR